MYPELFRIGDFPITTYGLMLAIGMVLALFVASRLAARDGLPKERIYDLGLWTLIGGLLGSKILMIIVEDNVNIFSLDFLRSGGIFYGGLFGGFFAVVFLIRCYKLPFWKVADAFAPAVALGQAFGRQGCFAAGCCWGKGNASAVGRAFLGKRSRIHGRSDLRSGHAELFCIRHSFTNQSRCLSCSACWFIFTKRKNLTDRF